MPGEKTVCSTHCWHVSGTMITDGIAQKGDTECRCCRCGVRERIGWRMKSRRLRGHGPFAAYNTLVYDEPVHGHD